MRKLELGLLLLILSFSTISLLPRVCVAAVVTGSHSVCPFVWELRHTHTAQGKGRWVHPTVLITEMMAIDIHGGAMLVLGRGAKMHGDVCTLDGIFQAGAFPSSFLAWRAYLSSLTILGDWG